MANQQSEITVCPGSFESEFLSGVLNEVVSLCVACSLFATLMGGRLVKRSGGHGKRVHW